MIRCAKRHLYNRVIIYIVDGVMIMNKIHLSFGPNYNIHLNIKNESSFDCILQIILYDEIHLTSWYQ